MELHYGYEDIEDYVDYEDPEGTMLAHRQQLGVPSPIPLAEPWELGPPVLIRDEPNWPPPGSAAGEVDIAEDDGRWEEDEVANLVAADWRGQLDGIIRAEMEDRGELGADDGEAWNDVVVPDTFADIDPALYRFETAASAAAAVEAWMTAEPLADPDSTAALVLNRAEARPWTVAPEQMAVDDQLRSEGRRSPLEAMRTIAPTIGTEELRGGPPPGEGPSPTPQRADPTLDAATPALDSGSGPSPLGPWTSLSSQPGLGPELQSDPTPSQPDHHLRI